MNFRRWGARVALGGGGVLLGLLAAELIVRQVGIAPEIGLIEIDVAGSVFVSSDDAVLAYEPKPGSEGINSWGHRGPERQLEKAAGVRRVVVLGDSVAFGFCNQRETIPPAKVFGAVLEDRLGGDFEVINLGVTGYDAVQEVRRLERDGIEWDPDLVLVAATVNDNADASLILRLAEDNPGWERERALVRLIGNSRLGSSALWRLYLQMALLSQAPAPDEVDSPVRIAYERLDTLRIKHGFKVLVAMFPGRQPPERYPARVVRLVKDQSERNGFEFFDLEEAMRGREEFYEPCTVMHPNERGHAAAAEELLPVIRRLLGDP